MKIPLNAVSATDSDQREEKGQSECGKPLSNGLYLVNQNYFKNKTCDTYLKSHSGAGNKRIRNSSQPQIYGESLAALDNVRQWRPRGRKAEGDTVVSPGQD